MSGPLTVGNGDTGTRLAILPPKGVNIPKNQDWFLSLIQSSLTSNFNKYSKMTVLDRQHLEDVISEQKLSASGDFSDEDYIKMGKLTNAQYILVGTLIKKSANSFLLDLAITDPETGVRRASFGPKQYTLEEIEDLTAAKDAAYELLTQSGLTFTDAGKKSLYETAKKSDDAETALAKGISAEKSGATLVEVMQYYYQAVDYDAEMKEAINRLAKTNKTLTNLSKPLTVVQTGNIRNDAQAKIAAYKVEQENKRIDAENRQVWVKQLTDCENYFEDFFKTANTPLELVYSTIEAGNVDVINETMALSFNATLVPLPLKTSWFNAAEQTINAMRKALIETGRAKDWGLEYWPKTSVRQKNVFINSNKSMNYDIKAELVNENDKVISTASFTLTGGWNCTIDKHNTVEFSPYYGMGQIAPIAKVVFQDVEVASITDKLTINIAKINSTDAETASANGVLAITQDDKKLNTAMAQAKRAESNRQKEAKRAESNRQKEAKRAESNRQIQEFFSDLWDQRCWWGINALCEPSLWDISALNPKLEPGEEIHNGDFSLYSGKFGGEFGFKHFSFGGSFVVAGYSESIDKYEIKNSVKKLSDSYSRKGLGVGGDFFMGYSWYSGLIEFEKWLPFKASIDAGITFISLFQNELNLEMPVIPYFRVRGTIVVLTIECRLELPVINGTIVPQFGLGMGENLAYRVKKQEVKNGQ